jgi:hypothetical protein
MKIASTLLTSTLILGAAMSTAQSEICWQLTPYTDIIRATEITDAGNVSPLGTKGSNFGSTHTIVFGNWIAPITKGTPTGAGGTDNYTLPFVGAIEFDDSSTTAVQTSRFNIHASNHTHTAFGNHTDCTLDALLGASGSWKITCDGNVAGSFKATGSPLTLVDCENQPAF